MKTIISSECVKARVKELGREIAEFYAGKELTVVGVMNGAMIFCADLVREIDVPMYLDSISVSSYDHLSSSGKLNFRCYVKLPVRNRHILLVDDIFDTGFTMMKVMEHFKEQGALSVESCCLLNKKEVSKKAPLPRWIGFDIPKVFVVGYGLDADELYRNMPEILDFES